MYQVHIHNLSCSKLSKCDREQRFPPSSVYDSVMKLTKAVGTTAELA